MARRKVGQGGIQMVLPTIEWRMCACGCGQMFVANENGRPREYLNDSHKKRSYRGRKATQQQNDEYSAGMWEGFTDGAVRQWADEDKSGDTGWWALYELERRGR